MTALRDDVSFLNHFWAADKSGMENLINYMYTTHDELKQLYTVYRKRAQLEYEYSQSLLNLASPFTNSQKDVYHTLYLELQQSSLSHLELSNQLQSDVAFHLRNKLDEYELILEKWRMTLETLFNEREQLTLKLLKVQAKYLKEYNVSNEKNKHEALKDKYRDSVEQVNNISKEWNVVWADACRTLEAMEEDRVEFIKINMWEYANKICESLLVQDNWCENIRLALEKYTVELEIINCIENYGTGTHIPTTKDYVDEVYQSQKAKKNQKEHLRLKKQQSVISTRNESIETKQDIYQKKRSKNLLNRSDSSNLPRQPYEYKPDTGSFPRRKNYMDTSSQAIECPPRSSSYFGQSYPPSNLLSATPPSLMIPQAIPHHKSAPCSPVHHSRHDFYYLQDI